MLGAICSEYKQANCSVCPDVKDYTPEWGEGLQAGGEKAAASTST